MESQGAARFQRRIFCFLDLIFSRGSLQFVDLPTFSSLMNHQAPGLTFSRLELGVLERRPWLLIFKGTQLSL